MSKFRYELSSVLGSVYKGGNVLFTQDGKKLLSPIGNRVSVFDLLEHKTATIDAVTHRDIETMAISPDGHFLLAIDVDGGGCFVNLATPTYNILTQMHFQKPVTVARFSPNSKFLAIAHGEQVQLWEVPSMIVTFRPLTLRRTLTGHAGSGDIRCLDWSIDGKYLLTGSTKVILHRITDEPIVPSTTTDIKVGMAGQATVAAASANGDDETPAAASAAPAVPHLPPIELHHKGEIVGCYFGQPSSHLSQTPLVYTVSKDGKLFVWDWVSEEEAVRKKAKRDAERIAFDKKHGLDEEAEAAENKKKRKAKDAFDPVTHASKPKRAYTTSLFGARGKFELASKHYFNQNHATVICCALHPATQVDLLVVGFSSGVFGLYELPDFNEIHTLSISQKRITTVSVNSTGQWLAFGCAKLGQLLVWEWQSESYVLKQQGHFYDVNCVSFAPDGQVLATGGDDGKVKLWNTTTGFCFVTFTEHTAPVTACHWSSVGNVLVTASIDGTVRAYDLVRYRNFRTMTSTAEDTASFTSLAVDPSGEIVCAGARDPFKIYVWNLKTGALLESLPGHSGPLASLSFAGARSLLASASWDKTVKLWDVFTGKGCVETFTHPTDVLAVAFRFDGKELVAATLAGNLHFWDVANGAEKFVIEGKKDIQGGRRVGDARAADNATHNTGFTSVCYSADGKCVLAGGNSRFVVIYDVASRIRVKRFVVSSNLSMDGILDKLNSKRMTEAGTSMDLIEDNVYDENDDDPESRRDTTLPGARSGDFSSRRTRPAVRSKCVRFSPTGAMWAAATTDGLLLYGLDSHSTFNPEGLTEYVTPEACRKALRQADFSSALKMALALNQPPLLLRVLESTPVEKILLVASSIARHRLDRLIEFLATTLASSAHLEYMLQWCQAVLSQHATFLLQNNHSMITTFRHLAKVIREKQKEVVNLCDENTFTLEYLAQLGQTTSVPQTKIEVMHTANANEEDESSMEVDDEAEKDDKLDSDDEDDDEEEEAKQLVESKKKPTKQIAPAASLKQEAAAAKAPAAAKPKGGKPKRAMQAQ